MSGLQPCSQLASESDCDGSVSGFINRNSIYSFFIMTKAVYEIPSKGIANKHEIVIVKGFIDSSSRNINVYTSRHTINAAIIRFAKSINRYITENILNDSDGFRMHPIHFHNCSENVLPSGKMRTDPKMRTVA